MSRSFSYCPRCEEECMDSCMVQVKGFEWVCPGCYDRVKDRCADIDRVEDAEQIEHLCIKIHNAMYDTERRINVDDELYQIKDLAREIQRKIRGW